MVGLEYARLGKGGGNVYGGGTPESSGGIQMHSELSTKKVGLHYTCLRM